MNRLWTGVILGAVSSAVAFGAAWAQVARYVDAQGVIHYVGSEAQIPEQYRGQATSTGLPTSHGAPNSEVRQDRQDIRQDTREIGQDRRDLARDHAKLEQDAKAGNTQAVNADRRELRKDGEGLRADRRELRKDERDNSRDRADLRRDLRDRRHDRRYLRRDVVNRRQDRRDLRHDRPAER